MSNYYQQLYDAEATQPRRLKRKKRRPGCLLFLIVVLFLCGAGYLFLTLEPSENRQQQADSGPRIHGELSDEQQMAFDQLSDQSARSIELQEQGGSIRALMLDVDMGYPQDPERQVQAFMQIYQSLYQIKDFNQEFVLTDMNLTEGGNTVLKYSQVIESIPVYSSQLIVVVDNRGSIKLVSGGYLTDDHLWFEPAPAYGIDNVFEILKDNEYSLSTEGTNIELVLYNDIVLGNSEGQTELAYWILANSPAGKTELVVSAVTGEIFLTARLRDDLTYEILNSDQRHAFECNFDLPCEGLISGDVLYASPGGNREDLNYELDQLRFIIDKTLLSYDKYLNWSGYDNNDSNFIVLVNIEEGAFHLQKSECGEPIIVLEDAAIKSAYDVFPHEFQHAVTRERVTLHQTPATAEAGALNEAFSDIFTTLIDSENPWQIHLGDRLLRDMKNPGKVNYQIYHYDNFVTENSPEGRRLIKKYDLCTTHFSHQNSTIISHAAYLIAEGGSKRGISVEAIGIGDMTKIFFNSQDYLPYNATFFLARWSVIQACEDYYPDNVDRCDSVRNAFAIVGIGDPAPQPSLLDRLFGILGPVEEAIINARIALLEGLYDKLQALNVQVDDFFIRMQEDMAQLLIDMFIKLVTTYIESMLASLYENVCGSLLMAFLLPGSIYVLTRKMTSGV